MIRGSIVALVTPMTSTGEVDYSALEALVEHHIAAGTHGIVAVGTTGESATLPTNEHVEVVKAVVKTVAGRVKVIAGNGANSTAEAIELTKAIAPLGVDAFLNVTPYYNKPSQKGLIAHFEAIADASDIPQILYNVPGRTAVDMLPETVAHLAKHDKIIGIKEATGSIQRLKDIQALVDGEFILLSGDDETGLAFLKQGGHGVISVTNNVAAKRMADMCNAVAEGDVETAEQIDSGLRDVHSAMFVESNPVPVKWALSRMGLIPECVYRLPLVQPELNTQKIIEQALSKAELI
ncbi:4-hydroxy-tetrahydrodipicolinate synthase [Saccharobesus litoralis]|uniref:4-hydroxy-tetrahydrodipicolinate synthase n=1 Tax=Saccharobesus litoralis TaxID=2172099 RepID=A0A2S0VL80_9ALTE|nr:4-hydroxy-tetrahydrodipicolinate synthase [Saccharobesus litoralis]AWB64969.1 4-hydroxy-tetrahydrodipicolinate synthase [Saccharobesus litoralis]